MKYIVYCFYIAIVFICLSCSDQEQKKFLEIDNVMESSPDSAMCMLTHIDKNKLTDSDLADYALLFTQAQFRTGITVDSDTLIKHAYAKYIVSRPCINKIKAYFYNACVHYNKRESLSQAMKDALNSYEISKDLQNPYWEAKSAELISDIFVDAYNYSQAEIYAHRAIKAYEISGHEINRRYVICDLASIYLNQNKCEQAITILDSLQSVCVTETPIDSALITYIRMPLVAAMIRTNRYDELNSSHYDVLNRVSSNALKIDALILESYITQNDGKSDEATSLLFKANSLANSTNERALIIYASYETAKQAGDYRKAAMLTDSLLNIQSTIAENILNESVTSVQRDYYSQEAIKQERKSNALYYILICVISVALIIIFFARFGLPIETRGKA
jgi:hypothetical protein